MYRYRGDYLPGYGDPGIFGAIGHVLGGAVTGFISRGPIGGILGALGGTAAGAKAGMQPAILAAGGSESAYTPELRARHAALVASSKTGATLPIGGIPHGSPHGRALVGPPMAAAAGGMRGYHVIKKGPKAGMLTKNRRMNWANSRALSRSERRIKAAVRHFRRYFHWVHPKQTGTLQPTFHKGKKRA